MRLKPPRKDRSSWEGDEMPSNSGQTVAEILTRKKSSIRSAELEEGSPSWDAILDMMWEEVVQRAKQRERGFKSIRKLISDGRFDR